MKRPAEEMFNGKSIAPRLAVLSHGMGQDSTTLLEMLIDDPAFRARYAPNDLLVVFSHTGDEFDETVEHTEATKKRCRDAGIEFHHITPDLGFHSKSWPSLREFYRANGAIGSKSYVKSCSAQLKITPIYKFLEHWLSEKYGVQCHNKKGIREFAAKYGKIDMIIGIAKNEEKRITDPSKNPSRWYRESINPVYPLIDLGMARQDCQNYLHKKNLRVIPSNCKACPFLSLPEVEYLRRFCPSDLTDWVKLEQAKLTKYRHKEQTIATDKAGNTIYKKNGDIKYVNKNYGVFGLTPLPSKISEAQELYKSWSDERVREYRYSHGHCVATAY